MAGNPACWLALAGALWAGALPAHAQSAPAQNAPAQSALEIQSVRADGLEAWLVEDRSAVVQLHFAWAAPTDKGAPSGKAAGLTNLTIQLLDDGAADLDGITFRRRLAALGARWRARATTDGGWLTVRMLARHKQDVWALVLAALREPNWDRAALRRAKSQAASTRRRQEQSPATLAERLWMRAAFPTNALGDSVFGNEHQSFRRADITAHRARLFTQSNTLLVALGDLRADELQAWLTELAAALPHGNEAAPTNTSATELPPWQRSGELLQIARAGPQTELLFGQYGPPLQSEDYLPALLLNLVLGGGGLNNRLMREVREKQGWAYKVRSYLVPLPPQVGRTLWLVELASDNTSAHDALALARAEMDRLRQQSITADELAAAKRQFNGRMAVRLRSGRAIAEQLLFSRLHGRDKNHIKELPARINAVTLADIRRASARYLNSAEVFTIAVGASPHLLPAPQ